MMRWLAVPWVLAAASASAPAGAAPEPAPPATAPRVPATQSSARIPVRLNAIVKKLQANAELWLRDEEIDAGTEIALKTISFDPGWVPALRKVLDSTQTDAAGLYVVNRLLRQLAFARRDTIRAALPSVKALHSRAKRSYQPLLDLTERQIKALKQPSDRSPNARKALAERRAKKVEKEQAVAKHNLMVYVLERRAFQLMLLAQESDEDKALALALIRAEKERSAIFLTLLDGFASEARKMLGEKGRQRAEKIYGELRPFGLELRMEKKRGYANRGKVQVRDDDASTFERTDVYPGITILKALNRIATAARMPALKVPKEKEIIKYHADKAKKARPRRDRRR